MKIVFATGNENKLRELQNVIPKGVELVGLKELGITEELPEDHATLEENAEQKAKYIFQRTGHICFADDTGLEVASLKGEPGVYSARYAGEQRSAVDNMAKVLKELREIEDRSARFRTVIALVGPEGSQLFEGIVNGKILNEARGAKGFGYDPIFQPDGEERSFAEMDLAEKNKISHRARATIKLLEHLGG